MEPKRILYPLLFFTCIQLSVVIAAFRNNKQTFVENVAHPQMQRKVNGRHRSHIVTLYGDNHDNYERSQKRGNAKTFVANDEHPQIQRKVNGRHRSHIVTLYGDNHDNERSLKRGNAKTFVANDEHPQIQRKVNGRHNSQYEPFAGSDSKRASVQEKPQKTKTADENTKSKTSKTSATPVAPATKPVTDLPKTTAEPGKQTGNNSKSDSGGGGFNFPMNTANMVDTKTAFFILVGVTVLVIGCFAFRIIRSRSRRKTKKYGILATRGSEVELTPLDQEEDDEDMTVFDANSK